MRKAAKIKFLDDSLRNSFYKLSKGDDSERELFRFINQAFDNIEINGFCGIQMSKRLIPKEYKKLDIKNLWKYDLPNGWRLLYSITNSEIQIISLILEWLSHKEYERKLKY